MTTKTTTNRLAKEKSPYLLQHAHNPVDWYPWGKEAFDKAKAEDKPIFLSIGYSTCHWCHVMERESFENEQIARVLNEHFLSIKVDREERPDVDHVYMTAVQALTGQGGWPLSAFLTPDLKPFFGGTYFPPEDRWGRPGFATLLERIRTAWKENRVALLADAKSLADALALTPTKSPTGLSDASIKQAIDQFEASYDPTWGGFGGSPKFPRSVAIEFLFRQYARSGQAKLLEMAERQLVKMAEGGIYDQLGGGFHRYSTDEEWLVPHFEKMLYDNALLIRVYTQAWQITKKPLYERIVRETIAYLMRDMLAPEGSFYSAEDADSEGIEGKFYVWNPTQINALLGEKEGQAFCTAFGVTPTGNWEPQEPGIPRGQSVLRVAQDVNGAPPKRALLAERSKRVRPHRDDKVLTEWNALAMGALAIAGVAFEDAEYLAQAKRIAEFIRTKMRRPDGRLLRRYREGEAAILAVLDDYAFLADALVDLYQATLDVTYLEEALNTADAMIKLFADPAGGFWFTGSDGEKLIARMKETYDGALPSGNAVALYALMRLAELTSREDYRKHVEVALRAFASPVLQHPSGYPHLLSAYDLHRGPRREIVVAGDGPEVLRLLHRSYLPDAVWAVVPASGPSERARKLIPMTESKRAITGRPTAYVCENYSCHLPVTDVKELEKLLLERR